MTDYSLTIQISSQGLKTINDASQKITIVKEISPSKLPVAWVAFTPEIDNEVAWTESYSVYGSETAIQAGAIIKTTSTQDANGGNTYAFEGGQFNGSTNNLPQNQYGIVNNDSNFAELIGGLAQVAQVAGNADLHPLNFTVIPYNDNGIYTPIEKVQIFAQANVNNGVILSEVTSKALTVDLTQKTSQIIHYDDVKNTFQLGPLPKAQ